MASTFNTSIIDRLIPIVDRIRGRVNALAGNRPYRVFVVVRTWTGPKRGDGTSSEALTELLPAPKVVPMSAYQLQAEGRLETDTVIVTEISLTYAEADLVPVASKLQEVFFRLQENQGQAQAAREYVLDGRPVPDREKNIGWTLTLKRATR